MSRAEKLREAYYQARRYNSELKDLYSPKFEARDWITVGKTQRCESEDGWKLLVYEVEDHIEICVISPTGEEIKYLGV